MPDYGYVLIAAGLLAAIIAMIALPLREAQKLKKRLRLEFGKPPVKTEGLANAERFYTAYRAHTTPHGAVDDLTWHDLDMDEVFGILNACKSAEGDVRLYTVLRTPRPNDDWQDALNAREALVGSFDKDDNLRRDAQYLLARLGRGGGQGLENTIYYTDSLGLRNARVYKLLAVMPFVCLPLAILNAGMLFAAVAFLLVNLVLSTMTKNKNEANFRSVRHLASALTCARRLAARLEGTQPDLAKKLRAAAAPFRALGPAIWVLSYNEMVEGAIGFDILHFFMAPLLCYQHIVERLGGKANQVAALYRHLGEVDLALCILSWRHTLPVWCAPTFCEAPKITFTQLCHPLLDEPVPSSADFEKDVLLTGSNASGKSTFIKAVGLGCLLGQTLNTCCAEAFALKPGAVATSMAVADSVVDGDSYFVAEIKSMRRLMRMAQSDSFGWYFIDEILKGTNTIERVAASAAVLRALAAADCRCFAATHDTELTTMLAASYDNYHFRETVTDDGVHFDYCPHAGPATTRNAILLLSRMDFPEEVTHTAEALVERFESTGEWGKVE